VSPIISGQLREGTKAFGAGWDAIQIGDFNGDGKSDILWERRSDLARSIFLMNGLSANFQTFSGPLGPLANGRWTVQQIGDFNGDGKSDIVWQETFGSVVIWLMDGLSPSNNTQVLGTETGWSVSRIGDFNGDGKSDILWQHTDGSITMWIMNGLSLTISGGLLGPGTGWHPAP
jgi:hypothetical protein